MPAGWVAAGAAVLGAAASYAGSEKQAKGAEKGAKTQLEMFNRLNAQQQPYIQSGYGATSKLNTLLGIGGAPSGGSAAPSGQPAPAVPRATPFVPDRRIPTTPSGPSTAMYGAPSGAPPLPLKQILTMRAQQGDPDAQRILGNF